MKLTELFVIKEARNNLKSVMLTGEEIEALLYCFDYANENDDEGIRSSEPEADARNAALDTVIPKLRTTLKSIQGSDDSRPDHERHPDIFKK